MKRPAPFEMAVALTVAAALTVAVGCGSRAPGRLEGDGFRSLSVPYEVRYAEGRVGTFVSDEWSVESFAPINRRAQRKVHRRGPEWSGPARIDADGDGHLDDIGTQHVYDLRLSRDDGALLWVRHVPVPAHLDDASLEALSRLYVRDLSHGPDAYPGESLLIDADRRPSIADVQLLDDAELGVCGFAAFGIVVSAARPPPEGQRREAYVLVRTPFTWSQRSALGERRFATLMIVGYAGPHDERGLDDLGALLDAIRINPRSGS